MRNQGVRRSGVVSVVLVLLFSMSLVSQGVSAFESELMPCEVLRGPAISESGGALPEDSGVMIGVRIRISTTSQRCCSRDGDEAFGRLESVGVSEETAARVNYYKVLAL